VIHVAVALIRDNTLRWLCCQRGPNEDHAGYWEFPGGKFENGETLNQAMIREIQEELAFDLSAHQIAPFLKLNWRHSSKEVCLHSALINVNHSMTPVLAVHQSYKWLTTGDLRQLNWLESNIPIVAAIEQRY